MPEKQVWGIKVRFEENPEKDLHGEHTVSFYLFASKGKPKSQLFYTNRELATLIESRPELQDMPTGRIRYWIYPEAKFVQPYNYYPFANVSPTGLLDKAFATGIETTIVKFLNKKYRGFYYREGLNPTGLRQDQLKKRNMKIGQGMPLGEFLSLLQRVTRQWKREKRNKARMKRRPQQAQRTKRTRPR